MRFALENGDSKLALREVSKLTIKKILNAREAYNDAVYALREAERSVKFLNSRAYLVRNLKYRITEEGAREHRRMVEQATAHLEQCRARLAETPRLPMLSMLQKENEEKLLDALQLIIIQLVKNNFTTERMNPDQIYDCALRIMTEFKGLTLEDVALCLNMAQNGAYGTIYNRIDTGVILDWLRKYQDKMQALGMDRELQKHVQGKAGSWRDIKEYRILEPRRLRDMM